MLWVTTVNGKKKRQAFCIENLLQFCLPLNIFMLLWKHNLTIIFWVFLSPLWYSIYCPDKAIRVWSQSSCKKTSYPSTKAMLRVNTGETQWLGSVKGSAMSAFVSWAEKKRDVVRWQGGESERHCGRERHNGRQEKEHIYLRLPWCITSLPFPGKKKKWVRWLINCPAHRRRTEKSLPSGTVRGKMIISWLSGSG